MVISPRLFAAANFFFLCDDSMRQNCPGVLNDTRAMIQPFLLCKACTKLCGFFCEDFTDDFEGILYFVVDKDVVIML